MTGGPPVSVIIVNNGRRDELALVLKALEYQRYRNFELVVVSDLAPRDRPQSALAPRWIEFAEPNISRARNLGIAAARGEVVAFCDDDAVPEFNWLQELTGPFLDDCVGAVGGWVRGRNGVSWQWKTVFFDDEGQDHPGPDMPQTQVFAAQAGRYLKTVGTNCAFRRDALQQIGGFDEAFHFYLDEADVNLRLARAGWSAATVPSAQVLHGFAASARRTVRRVPTTLFQIAASQSWFVTKHGDPTGGSIDRFRQMQTARLDRLFLSGLLTASGMRKLGEELDAGLAEGRARKPGPGLIPPPESSDFQPVPATASGRRILVSAGILSGREHLKLARQAAAAGDEVTLILPELSHRPLTVSFCSDGVFRHRYGLVGKAERHQARPMARPRDRTQAEMERILPFRGPFGTVA